MFGLLDLYEVFGCAILLRMDISPQHQPLLNMPCLVLWDLLNSFITETEGIVKTEISYSDQSTW